MDNEKKLNFDNTLLKNFYEYLFKLLSKNNTIPKDICLATWEILFLDCEFNIKNWCDYFKENYDNEIVSKDFWFDFLNLFIGNHENLLDFFLNFLKLKN
jgi:hypothetical protein